jgi:hypothetical protein
MRMKVTNYDATACSAAQGDLAIEIPTDDGIISVGETDTNSWIGRECGNNGCGGPANLAPPAISVKAQRQRRLY